MDEVESSQSPPRMGKATTVGRIGPHLQDTYGGCLSKASAATVKIPFVGADGSTQALQFKVFKFSVCWVKPPQTHRGARARAPPPKAVLDAKRSVCLVQRRIWGLQKLDVSTTGKFTAARFNSASGWVNLTKADSLVFGVVAPFASMWPLVPNAPLPPLYTAGQTQEELSSLLGDEQGITQSQSKKSKKSKSSEKSKSEGNTSKKTTATKTKTASKKTSLSSGSSKCETAKVQGKTDTGDKNTCTKSYELCETSETIQKDCARTCACGVTVKKDTTPKKAASKKAASDDNEECVPNTTCCIRTTNSTQVINGTSTVVFGYTVYTKGSTTKWHANSTSPKYQYPLGGLDPGKKCVLLVIRNALDGTKDDPYHCIKYKATSGYRYLKFEYLKAMACSIEGKTRCINKRTIFSLYAKDNFGNGGSKNKNNPPDDSNCTAKGLCTSGSNCYGDPNYKSNCYKPKSIVGTSEDGTLISLLA